MGLEPAMLGLMGGSMGMQGLQSLFGGADPAELSAYAHKPGEFLDPVMQMGQHFRDRAHLGGVLTGKAARPVTMPGAFAQPTPWYSGGGMPFPIGLTGQDPALFAPGLHQQRAGYQFAQPDYGQLEKKKWTGQEGYQEGSSGPTTGRSAAPTSTRNWMFGEYAPRFDPNAGFNRIATTAQWGPQTFGALDQPQFGAEQPQVGGGIPQLRANLELIGVTSNPDGTFRADAPQTPVANPQLFSGTKGVAGYGGEGGGTTGTTGTTTGTTETTGTTRVDDPGYVPQPGDYVDADGVVHRYNPAAHQRDVDYTPYGSPRSNWLEETRGVKHNRGAVTGSSGEVLPIDPSTGAHMGTPFPGGTAGASGGEYAPIPGMSDPDSPGSSFMPPDAMWGRQDLAHPFNRPTQVPLPRGQSPTLYQPGEFGYDPTQDLEWAGEEIQEHQNPLPPGSPGPLNRGLGAAKNWLRRL